MRTQGDYLTNNIIKKDLRDQRDPRLPVGRQGRYHLTKFFI